MKLQDLQTSPASDLNYQNLRFDYTRHADQDCSPPASHPVVVVGAGLVGLALAIDLAQQGQAVLLLDNDCTLSTGSRAICFAKRTLEVFDRLGCGPRMVAKGVSWNVGRVFFKNEEIYSFDLLPESGHERPAFINLQQYYVEGYLAERSAQLPLIDLRWKSKVVGISQHTDHALLTVETPDGAYQIKASYVAACDGSRSNLRKLMGQESQGRVFRDRFLIADVKVQPVLTTPKAAKPAQSASEKQRTHAVPGIGEKGFAERWFWFDPEVHPNQSVLLHKQPDDVWRIDFQLGWDADPEEEKKPEKIIPRVKALLGDDAQFELEWASVYTFACQRMERFRHGRVLFAGDAAHGVSPFGARGANSGVQDADNLAWKLAAVLRGEAPDALLDSYASEREYAADENIRNSTRATDFITPKSDMSRLFRDAVLELAKQHSFARTLVNSGRLSLPSTFLESPLNTPDADKFDGVMVPGAPAADAPVVHADGAVDWLLRTLRPTGFTALVFGDPILTERLRASIAQLKVVSIGNRRANELAWLRYDATPGTVYLFRPDQHVCARWRFASIGAVRTGLGKALERAVGQALVIS